MFVSQLLEKNQQNLEFPKYHIVTPPPTIQETFGEQGRNYPGVWVGVTPLISISSGISVQFRQANFENI